jgi:hypothetical protein
MPNLTGGTSLSIRRGYITRSRVDEAKHTNATTLTAKRVLLLSYKLLHSRLSPSF